MEGVCLVDSDVDPIENLKETLKGLIEHLFSGRQYRFLPDYFPFTEPSLQIEVLFGDKWLEILGAGQIHSDILEYNNINKKGWAFGLGLERLAMILFEIPDIRLFWSDHPKFVEQFKGSEIVKFKPIPKIESISKDISFWLSNVEIVENKVVWKDYNGFCELVRDIFKDQVEEIVLFDEFQHPKTIRWSHAYRLKISSISITDPSELSRLANEGMVSLAKALSEMGIKVR